MYLILSSPEYDSSVSLGYVAGLGLGIFVFSALEVVFRGSEEWAR